MLAGFLDARLRERLSYVARDVAQAGLNDRSVANRIVAMALVRKEQEGLRTDTAARSPPEGIGDR